MASLLFLVPNTKVQTENLDIMMTVRPVVSATRKAASPSQPAISASSGPSAPLCSRVVWSVTSRGSHLRLTLAGLCSGVSKRALRTWQYLDHPQSQELHSGVLECPGLWMDMMAWRWCISRCPWIGAATRLRHVQFVCNGHLYYPIG